VRVQGRGVSSDDEWGRDQSVQGMRRVFALMEETQRGVLGTLGLSPLDRRLRVWRENTLRLFEKTWGQAAESSHHLEERQVADLYGACFVHILGKAGISVPTSALSGDAEVIRLAGDILK